MAFEPFNTTNIIHQLLELSNFCKHFNFVFVHRCLLKGSYTEFIMQEKLADLRKKRERSLSVDYCLIFTHLGEPREYSLVDVQQLIILCLYNPS